MTSPPTRPTNHLAHRVRQARQLAWNAWFGAAERAVDLRYRVDTRGIVRNTTELARAGGARDSNHYQGSSVTGFRRIVAASGIDPARSTFVDLGCGRGRALVLAAHHGFARVVGVELDPAMAAQARANLESWQRRTSRRGARCTVDVRQGDATTIDPPGGDVLMYLYNSFGSDSLQQVLQRITAAPDADRRTVALGYLNPVHADVVAATGVLVPLTVTRDWAVYRLRAPDGYPPFRSENLQPPL